MTFGSVGPMEILDFAPPKIYGKIWKTIVIFHKPCTDLLYRCLPLNKETELVYRTECFTLYCLWLLRRPSVSQSYLCITCNKSDFSDGFLAQCVDMQQSLH